MTRSVRERTYRFRCYPTPEQEEQLLRTFGACRWVYNEGLRLRQHAWTRDRVSLSYPETCRALTRWRNAAETAWLKDVSAAALQQSLRHLGRAYDKFFQGSRRYPALKRKGRCPDSATYVRTSFRWHESATRPGVGVLTLAKPREPLNVRWSRALPPAAYPVKVTVSRDRAGRFFVCLLVVEEIEPLPALSGMTGVGIDLGLTSWVTLNDGRTLEHPRLLRPQLERLARMQRELHRRKPGSRNRDKTRREIGRLYAEISDARMDALHKLTTRLVHENQVLVVEDLSVSNLMRRGHRGRRKRGLNRTIADAGWGLLLRQLTYKAKWYGRTVVVVNRFFPSTRMCSACGHVGPKLEVAVRSWRCGACGISHDRDVNAAQNLRTEGLRVYRAEADELPYGKRAPGVIREADAAPAP